MDKNSENSSTLKLIFSQRIYFLFLFLMVASAITPFVVYAILSGDFFILLVLAPMWMVFGISIWALYMSWSTRTEFLITRRSIEIFINRIPFLEILFDEIDHIITYTEEREIPPMRYRISKTATGHTLQFKGINLDNTIRLWCFGFGLHRQKKILSFLTKICAEKNIQINFADSPKALIKLNETLDNDVAKFRKDLKDEKKKKNLEKAVDGGPFF